MSPIRFAAMALVPCCTFLYAADAERIALFDPVYGTAEPRISELTTANTDRWEGWLKAANLPLQRVTATELGDRTRFSAELFPVLVSDGRFVPRAQLPALQQYVQEGGILVGLAASIPWFMAIGPNQDNASWGLAPNEPRFAWQSESLLNTFGCRYTYLLGQHDQGVVHTVAPLLGRFLPGQGELPKQRVASRFFPQRSASPEARWQPLIRSQRWDGVDTTPIAMVMTNGKARAVVCTVPALTTTGMGAPWPEPAALTVALVQSALALHRGDDGLQASTAIRVAEGHPLPPPLSRNPLLGVDPENAVALARWGRFNGSCLELGPLLASGQATPAPGPSAAPRGLGAGASVVLAVPAGSGERWLRVRCAVATTGPRLKISAGERLLFNEEFVCIDAGGTGNMEAPELDGLATEQTRCLYLPPDIGGTLQVTNAGSGTLWFDAIQIETRPKGLHPYTMGFGASGKTPPAISAEWGKARVSLRFSEVGPPGDPKRWAKIDAKMPEFLALKCPLQWIFEGTPEWAAITPERYTAEAKRKGGRPFAMAPDPVKFAAMADEFIQRYGDHIDYYELWNEANSGHFYLGSAAEYATLARALIEVIKQRDPTAKLSAAGMAGYYPSFVEPNFANGLFGSVDMLGLHVYAGKSTGWDVAFSFAQGEVYAQGFDPHWDVNEQGFVHKPGFWFTAPQDENIQAALTDQAVGRLLANGPTDVLLFNAWNQGDWWDHLDQGKKRPAYLIFADYLPLTGSQRLDIPVMSTDVGFTRSLYTAVGRWPDGRVYGVFNPSENPAFLPPPAEKDPARTTYVTGALGLGIFFGKATADGSQLTAIPDTGKAYVGIGIPFALDPARRPSVTIDVIEAEKPYALTADLSDGQRIKLGEGLTAGRHVIVLKDLPGAGMRSGSFTIRAPGKIVLGAISTAPAVEVAASGTGAQHTLPITAILPGVYSSISASCGGVAVPVTVANKAGYTEIRLAIPGRTVLQAK